MAKKKKTQTTYWIAKFFRIGGKVEFIPARSNRKYFPDATSLQDAMKIANDILNNEKLEAVGVTTDQVKKFAYVNIRTLEKSDAIYAARLATQDAYNNLFKVRNPVPGAMPPIDIWQKRVIEATNNLVAQEAILKKIEGREE